MSTPVNKEVAWDKSKTIMSKTDAKGTIEYVNQVFIDVCGYSEGELIGKPHNIIRHPDMPKTIFKILWDNIQKGINFHAIVKNMAKSGEYYFCSFSDYRKVYSTPLPKNTTGRTSRWCRSWRKIL